MEVVRNIGTLATARLAILEDNDAFRVDDDANVSVDNTAEVSIDDDIDVSVDDAEVSVDDPGAWGRAAIRVRNLGSSAASWLGGW